MLPAERVAAAFEKKPTDRVPIYQAGFSSRVASAIVGHEAYVGGGIQQFREARALWEGPDAHAEYLGRCRQDAWDLVRTLDLDLVRPAYWRMNERPTRRIDERTFFYGSDEGAWRVMRFEPEVELYQTVAQSPPTVRTPDDLAPIVEAAEERAAAYAPAPEDFPDLAAAQREFGGERAVPGHGIGIAVEREPVWLEAVALRPDLVARHLAAQAQQASRVPAVMARMGLRFLMGGGDFACKHGPFYSPAAFRRLVLPALRKVSDACHAAGTYHMFASDGDLWPVAADLFGASGVDCYYEIDRRAGMDLARLRDAFPRLTLLGGVSSATLHLGTAEDVVAETRSALEVARERGGIVVGCSNQIVAPTPIANFWAMMETLQRER